MAGFHGEYSNMSPPSVVLLLHGLTLVSLVFIARRPLDRLLHRRRVWLVTTFMMLTAMSLYIWHLLAIVLSLTTLRKLGHPPPTRLDATASPNRVDRRLPAVVPRLPRGSSWCTSLSSSCSRGPRSTAPSHLGHPAPVRLLPAGAPAGSTCCWSSCPA